MFMPAPSNIDDVAVQNEISRLQNVIEVWVKKHDLWEDCGFRSYLEYVNARPWRDYPVVSIFVSDGEFNRVFDGTESTEHLYEDFSSLLRRNGYWFERDIGRVYILADDPDWNDRYKDYFHWQWVCSLVKPDFSDLYDEIFEHFSEKPDDLIKLTGREFEILIYEALRNQGFGVDLRPRTGDRGIDITMLQRDPIGDILTAVQLKRYSPHRKIRLEAVQALHGAKVAYDMDESMFVTTSDFLPSAKQFARRRNVSMQLRTSSDVIDWCQQARRGIIENKAQLTSLDYVKRKIHEAALNPCQNIVRASSGVTVIMNSFALVLKETKHAALLMELPNLILEHDGFGQRGSEVPDVSLSALVNHSQEKVFRAKKNVRDGGTSYWTGQHLYSVWDGLPRRFDYCD